VAASDGTTTRSDVTLPANGAAARSGLLKNTSLSPCGVANSDPPMVTVSPGDTVVGLTVLTVGTGGGAAGSSSQVAPSEATSVMTASTASNLFELKIQVVFILVLHQGRLVLANCLRTLIKAAGLRKLFGRRPFRGTGTGFAAFAMTAITGR
jgi:hypothetical protein